MDWGVMASLIAFAIRLLILVPKSRNLVDRTSSTQGCPPPLVKSPCAPRALITNFERVETLVSDSYSVRYKRAEVLNGQRAIVSSSLTMPL